MKTPKLTKAAAAVKRTVRGGVLHLQASVRSRLARGYRLRFTHKAIVICVRHPSELEAGVVGGGGYVIPRGGAMMIARVAGELVFEPSRMELMRVPFGSESDAIDAMHRIQKRLLSNRPMVWAGRVVLLGITWLLVSSYLQVRARQLAAAEQVVTSNSGAAIPALPGDQSDMVAFPGASSPDSAPLPLGATAPDPVSAAPAASEPVVASSAGAAPSDSGLAGFGLDTSTVAPPSVPATVGKRGSTLANAGNSPTQGPGCDPALAFKAPAR